MGSEMYIERLKDPTPILFIALKKKTLSWDPLKLV